jgi:hypothetical protein
MVTVLVMAIQGMKSSFHQTFATTSSTNPFIYLASGMKFKPLKYICIQYLKRRKLENLYEGYRNDSCLGITLGKGVETINICPHRC